MNPYRAILNRTVIGGLVEERVADVLLSQFVGVAMQGLLGNVLQQIAEPVTFLEGYTG